MIIGLVGCGRWGRNILRDLVSLGAEVVVCTPESSDREQALGGGARAVHATLEPLLGAARGYVVASSSTTHAEIVERLLETDAPIFVEKPFTCDRDSAQRLAARGDGRLFVMHKWRYHPGVEGLARLAREGTLGEIHTVHTVRVGWGPWGRDTDASWVLLPHDLSIVLAILGHLPEVRSAVLTGSAPWTGSLLATLGGAGACDALMEIGITSPENRRAVTVVGSRATAHLSGSYAKAILLQAGAPGEGADCREIPADGPLPLWQELKVFIDHLRGGPAPITNASEGALVVDRIATIRSMAGLG